MVQGVRDVLAYHQDSLVRALLDLFPQIGFDKRKLEAHLCKFYCYLFCYFFSHVVTAVWVNEDTRRKFFINYAHDNGFDALDPNGWYTQSKRNILNQKVLSFHIYFGNLQANVEFTQSNLLPWR